MHFGGRKYHLSCSKRSSNRLKQCLDDGIADDVTFLPLLKLASSHFATQALYSAIQLNILTILGDKQISLEEIATKISHKCNQNALLRTLRLLTTIDIVQETTIVRSDGSTSGVSFTLTKLGQSLKDDAGMTACVQHWLERPLWDSWLGLTDYIVEGETSMVPFERANDGISSDFWYNKDDHPKSLEHANNFVRLVHKKEIEAVVTKFDWSTLDGKKLVDIGGHHGQLVNAIHDKIPGIDCYSLDLPNVISNAPKTDQITLVPGDVFDPSTIPSCDAILMKHFLDRCMWEDEETIKILQNCGKALDSTTQGILIIAEAVLPDYGESNKDNELQLYMDALYMLVGREGQRRCSEWKELANQAGFDMVDIINTDVPSISLICLKIK
jgi:hypothetical protein